MREFSKFQNKQKIKLIQKKKILIVADHLVVKDGRQRYNRPQLTDITMRF